MGVLQKFFNRLGDKGLQFDEGQDPAAVIGAINKDVQKLGSLLNRLGANIDVTSTLAGGNVKIGVNFGGYQKLPLLSVTVEPSKGGGFYVLEDKNSGFMSMMFNRPVATAAEVEEIVAQDIQDALNIPEAQNAHFLRALKSVYRPD